MSTISKIADIRNTYGFYSPEMADYIIILNRSKLVINDTNLYEQLDNLNSNQKDCLL